MQNSHQLDKKYQITMGKGIQHEYYWVYFLYYLGLFPVAPYDGRNLPGYDGKDVFNKESAQKLFTEQPKGLITYGCDSGRSEFGKAYLYLPYAIYKGSPEYLKISYFHSFVFIFALMLLFTAFWWIRQTTLGVFVILLIGSNPLQLYEVYANDNLFGWNITTALIILAIYLPILSNRKVPRWYLYLIPVLTGLFLGTVRQVRSEPIAIIIASVFSLLTIHKTNWSLKLGLIIILFLSFFATLSFLEKYFDYKIEEANKAVASVGGHPYKNYRQKHHNFWHPIWAGMGDFDTKYGHEWLDTTTWKAVKDYCKEINCGVDWDKMTGYLDKEKKYRIKIDSLQIYEQLLKEMVIKDIIKDPFWYVNIIIKRVTKVIKQTTPMRFSFGSRWIDLPIHFPKRPNSSILFFALLLLLLIIKHDWFMIKVICFTLPLSATAILIYAHMGSCYYSTYHIFTAAVLLKLLVDLIFSIQRIITIKFGARTFAKN